MGRQGTAPGSGAAAAGLLELARGAGVRAARLRGGAVRGAAGGARAQALQVLRVHGHPAHARLVAAPLPRRPARVVPDDSV